MPWKSQGMCQNRTICSTTLSSSRYRWKFPDGPKDDIQPGARYATFTHCYVIDDSNSQLIQSTIGQCLSPRPLSIFRDAFTVLQRMGLQYLWIDRLCVVQDSLSFHWMQPANCSFHRFFLRNIIQNLSLAEFRRHDVLHDKALRPR